ncbi:AbrB/MazE/SpoVT family DNA-binding domain-containing protein [Candidatus Villigracilis saccharophilus]|uniref:AbrB/MazE/SpoVT family DNA-binding domain-containing protein n=1 Tax=Candidatus Villigracilis saccharophilus TaxID=3140684 RepID=UPI003135E58F|nr:hypothetical protein [Anaerolineales bacterium]
MAKIQYAQVDEHGRIVLPSHLASELGIIPGDEIRVEPNGHGLHIRTSIMSLKRVYVEVTNKCNLNCSTCMRNVWDVKYGRMSDETFRHILWAFKPAE